MVDLSNETIQKNQQDPESQYNLALRYCVTNEPEQARYWFVSAATHGHVMAKKALEELRDRGILT